MQIYDPNSSTQTPVASFVAHQHMAGVVAGAVWVDGQQASSPYVPANALCNEGSEGYSLPSAVQMSIYMPETA